MKRLFALLVILCLPLSFSPACARDAATSTGAQPLAARLGVPERVVEEPIQTSTGRTTITIDAAVEIPDVTAVSTYEVAPRIMDEAEIKAIANAFGFAVKNVALEENRNSKSWTYLNFHTATFRAHNQTHDIYFTNEYIKEAPARAFVQVTPKRQRAEYTDTGDMYPYAASNEKGSKYTREEAIALATQIAAKAAPELSLNASGIVTGQAIVYGDGTVSADGSASPVEKFPYGHWLLFTRTIDGIPVTVARYYGAPPSAEFIYAPPFLPEQLSVIISDMGLDNATYRCPYDMKGVLRENVPLIPFAQVMEVAKAILPLKVVANENRYNENDFTDMRVNRVTFGYMRVNMRDQPDRYEMLPVWDFFYTETSRVFYDGEWHHFSANGILNSLLTVSAIDGTIIDRDYGY